MATTRVIPPADGLHQTIVLNGRTYTCASGSTLDVPDFDAALMIANGWTAAAASVGATAARPTSPKMRESFHDTTLGYNVVWDGKAWRNPATGAAV